MEFLKLDPDIDTDPVIMRAGWWGARFYELLLKVSAKKDLKGRIPLEFQDLGWLARMWNLQTDDAGMTELGIAATMARAQDAAIRAGLVVLDGTDWVLKGWEKYYRPASTSTERMRHHRAKKPVTDVTDVTNVTGARHGDARDECDDTPRTSHHTTHTTPPTHVERTAAPERAFVPSVPEKPEKPDDLWDGMDFWAWAQTKRLEAGLQPERRPNERKVSSWWSQLGMQGVGVQALRRAFVAFGCDPYWTDRARAPPVPFGGFLTQWERFLPVEVKHASG